VHGIEQLRYNASSEELTNVYKNLKDTLQTKLYHTITVSYYTGKEKEKKKEKHTNTLQAFTVNEYNGGFLGDQPCQHETSSKCFRVVSASIFRD
jgi:hypothetical protein